LKQEEKNWIGSVPVSNFCCRQGKVYLHEVDNVCLAVWQKRTRFSSHYCQEDFRIVGHDLMGEVEFSSCLLIERNLVNFTCCFATSRPVRWRPFWRRFVLRLRRLWNFLVYRFRWCRGNWRNRCDVFGVAALLKGVFHLCHCFLSRVASVVNRVDSSFRCRWFSWYVLPVFKRRGSWLEIRSLWLWSHFSELD
jgi:hypothetical protein